MDLLANRGYFNDDMTIAWALDDVRLDMLADLMRWMNRPLWRFWRTRWQVERPDAPFDWCVLCNMTQEHAWQATHHAGCPADERTDR